jgi:hypothetical protein
LANGKKQNPEIAVGFFLDGEFPRGKEIVPAARNSRHKIQFIT